MKLKIGNDVLTLSKLEKGVKKGTVKAEFNGYTVMFHETGSISVRTNLNRVIPAFYNKDGVKSSNVGRETYWFTDYEKKE